ncbi:alpha-1,2-fucosyltransferase, partial [Salmonella enterica]|nr:alpha-1,2-fucosyltransferase [Salmonella enterica]EAO1262791.1 alpha-1,2-fucosyltransferase [Salmonella enterica]EAO2368112.1 alpha-1,2-fucosyltransferase [Salmonella enterica]EBP7973572.1 alpha-1,2-fucosyltransferase [Salmonella enterica]EDN5871365.1 alpha-1,2-fucosyltransferase [Salmonella enterica]
LNKYEDKLVISPKQWFLGNNETSLRNASWITL